MVKKQMHNKVSRYCDKHKHNSCCGLEVSDLDLCLEGCWFDLESQQVTEVIKAPNL